MSLANNQDYPSMPIKEQSREIEIHDLSHDGRGVGRLSGSADGKPGKACFVSGALPGEKVVWKRVRSKRSFDEGDLVEVLDASADRVVPVCSVYATCGGCQLQHLEPVAQLAWKEHLLKRSAEKAGLVPESWLKPLSRESWNYRRRARLAVTYTRSGNAKIGFRSKGSHSIVEVSECVVLDNRLNALLPSLKGLADKLKKNGLTQIELSAGNEQLAICFYVKKPFSLVELGGLADLDPQAQIWSRLPGQAAEAVSDNAQPLIIQLTDQSKMSFVPSQFVQINNAMNRAMIEQALELTNPDSKTRVLDLYSGAGNFSLAFAEKSEHVLGVEGSAELCRHAGENARGMGYGNLDFQVMDLDKSKNFNGIRADQVNMVVLDPPRVGAAELVPWLNSLEAEKILYVSCHPATMLRDLKGLSEKYRIESMGVMDMFPHTAHLEAMALLIRS